MWCSAAGTESCLPEFADFKVQTQFRGKPAESRFTAPAQLPPNYEPSDRDLLPDSDERYRDSVALDVHKGPNFAGHYTVAQWSCGTGCSSGVVVDAETGHLYRNMPYGTLDISETPYKGLSFRIDSTLLIVEACTDADQQKQPDCSRNYYRWVPPRFLLIHKVQLPVPQWLKR
jgi:hypothetical protein